MAVQIQIRRDTTQNWYEINPILAKGEMGIEYLDNGKTKIKIGNGVDAYDSLDYFADPISYLDLINKPSINNVELNNNTSLIDLGIQPIGNYALYDDVVNGLSLKADADKTYTKEDIDTFFNNLLKIPAIEDQNGKYLKVLDGEIIWSDITGDMVSITKLNEELEKKVDKIDGYSLISIDELQRLSNISNYDDQPIKEDLELLKQEVDTKASINSLDNYVSKNDLSDTLDEYALKSDITSKAEASDLVSHISNTSNPHRVTAEQVGLGNVDNTSDMNKPISIQTQTALNLKQNILTAGNGIVIEDDIITNKSPNVQADWLAEEGLAEILHKPNLATVATSGSYNDLEDKPVIPSEYVLPIASSSQLGGIKVGSGLAIAEDGTLKTAGVNNYNDLEHKPSIGGITLIEGQTAEDLDLATSKATQSALNLKADKADTLAGYGITDAYTKEEVEARLSSVYKFKGSVPTYDNLPSENNIIGDVYNVEDTGSNYAWDGEKWDKLSETIDLTPYALKSTTLAGYGITDAYTKEEVDVKIAEKDSLPSQADKQGTFLSTNGTSAFWSALPESNDITKGIVKLASAEELAEGTSESSVITVKQFKDNLNLKQDNLIAGNGIAIENNTISATIEVPDNVIISDNYVNAKLWKGTLEEYDLLESHDDSVTYIITDDYTQVDYNYNTLQNKPQINSVELSGNKTLEELGIQASGDYALKSEIELKADKADTLDGYGITDGLSTSQITNCITKIPQDIKLELKDGTLTLKAGSKIYIPNGIGIFDEKNIDTDITLSALWAMSGINMLFYKPGDVLSSIGIPASNSNVWSGDNPTIDKQYGYWYDTTNNYIKYTADAGSSWTSGQSLPLAIVSGNGTSITSIDQVFNGFGYIGSHWFELKGIEGLSPNGRNEDGSLKNLNLISTQIMVHPCGKGTYNWFLMSGFNNGFRNVGKNTYFIQEEMPLADSYTGNYAVWESPLNNTIKYTNDKGLTWINVSHINCGSYITDNNRIISFEPKSPIKLADNQEVVHNTGNEEIYGIKTFKDEITAPNQVDYTQITNCIIKNQQNIFISRDETNSIIIKKDSLFWIPYGKTDNAISIGNKLGNNYFEVVKTDFNTNGFFIQCKCLKDCKTGMIEPAGKYTITLGFSNTSYYWSGCLVDANTSGNTMETSGGGSLWYDTANNIIYRRNSEATETEYGGGKNNVWISFPLVTVDGKSGGGDIDKVYHNYGFIGTRIYIFPGIEGLIPNGRNEDGSLKNIKKVNDSVKIYETAATNTSNILWTFLTDLNRNYRNSITHYISKKFINPTIETTASLYNETDNKIYVTNDKGVTWSEYQAFVLCDYIDKNGKPYNIITKENIQIIDRNDTDWASLSSKPSGKYIDLTLEASGSSYTAPANGYFAIRQYFSAENSKNFVGLYNVTRKIDSMVSRYTNSDIATNIIVQKGDIIHCYYSGITTNISSYFRFIYDEGAK